MNAKWLVTMLVAFTVAVSGCTDGTSGENDCPEGEECPTTTTTTSPPGGNNTNTTDPEPNVPPTLVYTITDEGGNETDTIIAGGNLTFSAVGSSDEDGTIENIAVTVTDANRTKGATQQLFRNGRFVDATFNFPVPGRSDVLIAMVDDDSGFTSQSFQVYINHPQDLGNYQFKLADPVGSATDCAGTAGDDILDAQYFKAFSFETKRNATMVAAAVTSGSASIALCDPDGNAISGEASDVVLSEPGTAFTASLDGYYVAVVSDAPNQEVGISVIVHYEPDTRS